MLQLYYFKNFHFLYPSKPRKNVNNSDGFTKSTSGAFEPGFNHLTGVQLLEYSKRPPRVGKYYISKCNVITLYP
jgi:hypothetical protein